MAIQLHSIVALHTGVSRRARDQLTKLYHDALHGPNFSGGVREMKALTDDVPDEPAEFTLPSLTAQKVFHRIETTLIESWDLMATRDRTNQDARADVIVNGVTLAPDVPVSTLLSLEKQLVDLRTVINAMPVRDPSKVWSADRDQGFFRAPEVTKAKTQKVVKGAELSPATDRHPAQVQAYNTDKVVGHYISTEFSGALSTQEREILVDRVNLLINAVKFARTEANTHPVTEMRIAADLLAYVFVG